MVERSSSHLDHPASPGKVLSASLGLVGVGACLLVFSLYLRPAFAFDLVSRWMLC